MLCNTITCPVHVSITCSWHQGIKIIHPDYLEFLNQGRWSDILLNNNIHTRLTFDPFIVLWGHFEAPYFKLPNDARVVSVCSCVGTCQRVRNSQRIAAIHDFHVPSSFFCMSTQLQNQIWTFLTFDPITTGQINRSPWTLFDGWPRSTHWHSQFCWKKVP